MSKPCLDKYAAIEVLTNEIKQEDLIIYTSKIKTFSTLSGCIMVILIFVGSKESTRYVDVHEVRMY